MRRREFITLLSGVAVAWPLTAQAQQPEQLPIIGILGTDETAWRPWTAAFVRRLRDLGWIEGRTVTIEYRWAEARPERAAEITAEFIRLKVSLIVSAGPAVAIVKRATADIPVVFTIDNDPVGGGLVASLERPGGNITGLSIQATDIAGKRLELLREVAPHVRQLAIIFNAGYPAAVRELGDVQIAARTLGVEAAPLEIRKTEDIAPAFQALKTEVDALYVVGDALVNANRTRIVTFALSKRLPTTFSTPEYVRAGGLMSYGASIPDLFRRAAELSDKILRGAKPADLPVEQPTKFELVINLKTATAIGLSVPQSLLTRADTVIE